MLGHERRERGDVPGIVDARDERAVVGVVERRGERIEVGGDGRRAGAPEGAHDVDALARAGEEDGGHLDVGGYPAFPPAYDADTRPQSTRNGSSTATSAASAAATTNAEPRPGGRRTSTTNAAPIAPAGSAISRYVPLIVSPSVDG